MRSDAGYFPLFSLAFKILGRIDGRFHLGRTRFFRSRSRGEEEGDGRREGGRGDLDACGESAITDWAVQLGRILLTARRDSELGFTALSEILPFPKFIFTSPVSQMVLPSASAKLA